MADDASESKPFFMTEEFPRDSVTPLMDVASLLAGITSLQVVTIDSGQVVLWKWRPHQGKAKWKQAEE